VTGGELRSEKWCIRESSKLILKEGTRKIMYLQVQEKKEAREKRNGKY
jgi:hypothetical protein